MRREAAERENFFIAKNRDFRVRATPVRAVLMMRDVFDVTPVIE